MRAIQSADVTDHIVDSHAMASILGFIGTPVTVVGRTVVQGAIDQPTLEALIEREARRRATVGAIMMRHRYALTLIVLFLSGAGAVALAHGGASGIVKKRMDMMETMGQSMKSLASMIQGEEIYRAERIQQLAKEVGGHGSSTLTALFPEGSDHAPSEALPVIWQDWSRFSGLADELSAAAEDLESSATQVQDGSIGTSLIGQSPVGVAYVRLANNCRTCHQEFRQKKDR